jgi:hypothetical protein
MSFVNPSSEFCPIFCLLRAGFGRLRFLGKVLVVERANQPNSKNANEKHQEQLAQGMPQVPSMNSQNQKNSTSTSEPIASRLGVDYPFPPHLEYVMAIIAVSLHHLHFTRNT